MTNPELLNRSALALYLHCIIFRFTSWLQTCCFALLAFSSCLHWAICCSVSLCLTKHLNLVFLSVSLALSARSVGMLWDITWWPHASPACSPATMVISGCSTVRLCPPSIDWMQQVWDIWCKNTVYAHCLWSDSICIPLLHRLSAHILQRSYVNTKGL